MARDRASIRIDMWADQDWREVSGEGQRLYMQLLSHPTLSYAGVAIWHPGRLAAMTGDLAPVDIERAGAELVARFFIVIDTTTEEVLVRSFVKHDGLMKQPKLVVSMANAYAAVASKTIREVIAFEMQKMHNREPDLKAWSVPQTQTLLKAGATDAHTLSPTVTPLFTPAVTPNGGQAQGLRTATTTSTATEASLPEGSERKKPETRLPKDWVPTAAHFERAKVSGVDIVREAEAFRLYSDTHDRHAANWNAAFTTWLTKSKPSAPAARNRDAWMNQ
jgi:hypothetical protein